MKDKKKAKFKLWLTIGGIITGIYVLIFYMIMPSFAAPSKMMQEKIKAPVNFLIRESTKRTQINLLVRKNKHLKNQLYFYRI